MNLSSTIKNLLKGGLLINKKVPLSTLSLIHSWNIRFGKYFYRKRYTAEEVVDKMIMMGMKKGSNIFIHSSWDSFYNYKGTEEELIDAILAAIGKEGTLAMPAYPLLKKGKIFDVRKSVTAAGLLPETFRHYPNVKRSVNVRHSVCALGPHAEYLTSEHHHSSVCFDEKSPYGKLRNIDALVFNLGLPPFFIGTIVHTVESTLRNSIPYFADFYINTQYETNVYKDEFGQIREYKSLLERGQLDKSKAVRSDYLHTKLIVKKYFDKSFYSMCKISNLNISVFDARYTQDKLIELAQKGIVLYITPRLKK